MGGCVEIVGEKGHKRVAAGVRHALGLQGGNIFRSQAERTALPDAVLDLDAVIIDGDAQVSQIEDRTHGIVDRFFRLQPLAALQGRDGVVRRQGGPVRQFAAVKGGRDIADIGLSHGRSAKTRTDRAAHGQGFHQLPAGGRLAVQGVADIIVILIPPG